MKNDIFDHDLISLNSLNKKYCLIIFSILIILVILLFLIKKDLLYKNIITLNDSKGIMVVEKDYLETVKEQKKVYINNVSYDYNIEKIEEANDFYLLTVCFPYELKNIDAKEYQIFLGKESIFKYFIRIMGG